MCSDDAHGAFLASLEEPLSVSAPLARRWAGLYCRTRACRDYHQFWQYLRLTGLGATLGGHPEVYVRAFTAVCRQWGRQASEPRRILIAGAADYSMLAHLWEVFRHHPGAVEISVLDRCRTPLMLNEWYAESRNIPVRLLESDILSFEGEGFDLVTTSSLLGHFSPGARHDFFDQIYRLLRDDGVFVSSNRLRPESEHRRLPVNRERVAAFLRLVVERKRTAEQASLFTPSELRRAALKYVLGRRPFPLNGVTTIEALANRSGLSVSETLRLVSSPSATGITIPTVSDGSSYLFFHLRRA